MPKAAFLAYVTSNEEGSTQHGLSYTARPPADPPPPPPPPPPPHPPPPQNTELYFFLKFFK